jgi:hypothetical protein
VRLRNRSLSTTACRNEKPVARTFGGVATLRRHSLSMVVALCMAVATVGMMPASQAMANQSCSQAPDSSYTGNGTPWDCNWTQINNNNWPANSQSPDCGNQCSWYVGGYGHGGCTWYSWTDNVTYSVSGIDFNGAADRAIKGWSALPYCSPGWVKCQGCSGDMLTVQDANEADPNACGMGWTVTAWQNGGQQYDNHIVSSTLEYNNSSSGTWSPGPPDQTGIWCDVIHIALHEGGHAMGEGHSTINNQGTMYWGGNVQESIDGDAEAMLNSVYGPYHNNGGAGGGGGCNGCSMACPQAPSLTTAATSSVDPTATVNQTLWVACGTSGPYINGYYAKIWDLSQGVALPNAAWYVMQAENRACLFYLTREQLMPWIHCMGLQ